MKGFTIFSMVPVLSNLTLHISILPVSFGRIGREFSTWCLGKCSFSIFGLILNSGLRFELRLRSREKLSLRIFRSRLPLQSERSLSLINVSVSVKLLQNSEKLTPRTAAASVSRVSVLAASSFSGALSLFPTSASSSLCFTFERSRQGY